MSQSPAFSIHLLPDEKKDLLNYLEGIFGLRYTGDLGSDYQRVEDVYKSRSEDFFIKINKFAKVPDMGTS